jgi:folate-binding protein YgfZ
MNISSDVTFTEFIDAIGAQINAAHRVSFPSDTTQPSTQNVQLSVLGHYALACFSGSESGKFLQGQTTCNIKDISTEKSLPGACCTPKGRMYCNFQLALDNTGQYWMRTRRDVIDNSLQTLNKYLALFRGSKSTHCADTHVILGISGDHANELITQITGSCPTQQNACFSNDETIAICIDPDKKRYELWLPASKALNIWPLLQTQSTNTDSNDWRLTNIRTGIGDVHAETREEFVPQMLNLQALDGISFNKGCYTGQEIVARMHYLGKLKKRMYRAICENLDNEPAAATELFAINEISNKLQTVGHVVEAVMINARSCELLVVIPDELVETGKAIHIGENGPQITVQTLPYAITRGSLNNPV